MNKSYAEISQIVGRNFIRVCKDRVGVYKIFLRNLKRKLNTNIGRHNNFIELCCANANTLKDKKDFRYPYEPIAILTNNLLANYIEKDCPNKSVLPMLGQAIFDASCNEIFGNKFQQDIQEEEQRLNIPQAKNDFDLFCLSIYAAHAAQKNIKFDEFMNQNREKLMQMYQGNPFNMHHDYHMPDWVDDGYNNNDDGNEQYDDEFYDDENEEIIDYANEPQNENHEEDVDDAFARLFNNN